MSFRFVSWQLLLSSFLLFCVLTVGTPGPFFEKLRESTFDPLMQLGIDVSMTPITTDMSMMTDADSEVIYTKDVEILVHRGEEIVQIEANEMNLYEHKIPIILHYELVDAGLEMKESRYFLCQRLAHIRNLEKIDGFSLRINGLRFNLHGVGKVQSCLF